MTLNLDEVVGHQPLDTTRSYASLSDSARADALKRVWNFEPISVEGQEVQINDEGFLAEYHRGNEEVRAELAKNIGVEMKDQRWAVGKFLRTDFQEKNQTATTRWVDNVGELPTELQFQLFLRNPARRCPTSPVSLNPTACVTNRPR